MARTILAVCSGGGHLKQLQRLVPLLPDVGRIDWLTYESGLSEQLEQRCAGTGDRVFYAPHAAPRDWRTLRKNAAVARKLIRETEYDLVISTGGAIAVAVLPLAMAYRIPTRYVESATRSHAPSTTGRILQYIPGIDCFTQYRSYAGRRWSYVGSLFDEYEPGPVNPEPKVVRVLVTVGTDETYGFERLITRVLDIADPEWNITWQIGPTVWAGAESNGVYQTMSADAMSAALRDCDVVIAHAGTGTALSAFDEGKCPVLAIRRQAAGEHIDDHQAATAAELARRKLAIGLDVDELTRDVVLDAARRSVQQKESPIKLAI